MRIDTETHTGGLELKLEEPGLDFSLIMAYEKDLDEYSFALRKGNEIEPYNPMKRRAAESDTTFYLRACLNAYTLLTFEAQGLVNQQGRIEEALDLKQRIAEPLDRMVESLRYWEDNMEEIQDNEVAQMRGILGLVQEADRRLGELT